jgi:hypothetical protein
MALELGPKAGEDVVAAARLAVKLAGLDPLSHVGGDRGRWWHAGLDDAVERAPAQLDAAPTGYDAAPSPRSSRGATRA